MKYIFFDLDGTLVNSSEGIIKCFKLTFSDLGHEIPDLPTMKTFIGPPLEVTFSQFGDDHFTEKALSIYRQYYRDKGVNQVSLYDGIVSALESLKSKGYSLYIATSKNHEMAVKMVDNLNISQHFESIFGALENSFTKTDILHRAIQELNIDISQALMIGDTKFDILGGKNVGMKTMGVSWGFGLIPTLVENGADLICHHPSELNNLIHQL